MKAYDVVALGELLVDFTENGMSAQGNPILEANPGGAPCNVLSMLQQLGKKTAFIGKVGADMFGKQLEAALKEAGIETKGLKKDETVNTTLAFVHTLAGGDREFSFYRNPGADMMLSVDDIDDEIIQNCKIFHFGSLSMTGDICKNATRRAIETAKKAGAILSFDPNLRAPLWSSLAKAKEEIAYGIGQCDILKISDNEILWFTGKDDINSSITAMQERFSIPLMLVSLGKDGSIACIKNHRVHRPTYTGVKTIETTGAGDTFGACVLNFILENGLHDFAQRELEEMLDFANAAASIVTTRKGALRIMPEKAEVEKLMREQLVK